MVKKQVAATTEEKTLIQDFTKSCKLLKLLLFVSISKYGN